MEFSASVGFIHKKFVKMQRHMILKFSYIISSCVTYTYNFIISQTHQFII